MKHPYTLIGLLLAGMTVSAENYFVDGTTWESLVSGTHAPNLPYTPFTHTLEGTATIDGYECLKLYETCDNDPATRTHIGWIRAEGNKIYSLVDETPHRWSVIYDFGLTEGTSATVEDFRDYGKGYKPVEATVRCTDIRTGTSGLTHRNLDILMPDITSNRDIMVGEETWIDGIGSIHGIKYNLLGAMCGIGSILVKVTSGGRTVYENNSYISPIKSAENHAVRTEGLVIIVSGTTTGERIALYSADGRLVCTKVSDGNATAVRGDVPGIYILMVGGTPHKVALK